MKNFKPTGDEKKLETEAGEYIDGLIDEFKSYEKDGLQIALIEKEEKKPEKEKDEKGKKNDKDEKEKKKEEDDYPKLDNSDILDPALAEKVTERLKELNK